MADHTSHCILLWLFPYSPHPAIDIFDPIRRFGGCSFPVESAIRRLDESILGVVNITPLLRFVKQRCKFESADVPKDS